MIPSRGFPILLFISPQVDLFFLPSSTQINQPTIHTIGEERSSFAPNLHEHCKAILSMDPAFTQDSSPSSPAGYHPCLTQLVRRSLGLAETDEIVDLDLQLIDLQPSTTGGASGELVFSGRLDNLCSAYQCIRALVSASECGSTSTGYQKNVQIAMIFDHEEVGSNSNVGAGSSMFMDTLRRIDSSFSSDVPTSLMKALRKSYVVSIDMAHAHHPNYPSKHDPIMAPKINQGLVIKHNCNQRYATNSVSAVMFREFGRLASLPVQEFSVRADMACGRSDRYYYSPTPPHIYTHTHT
jgi:aspartyl aminopeptidase